MNSLFILFDLIVAIFISFSFIIANEKNLITFVITMLCYFVIRMVFFIVKKISLKTLFIIITLCFILVSYVKVNNLFVLFLPSTLFSFISLFNKKHWIYGLVLVPILVVLNMHIGVLFALVYLTCYLLFYKINSLMKQIKNLNIENDRLRKAHGRIQRSLKRDISYHNEIRELSQLEERNKISQRIHDSIGHTITASILQLEAATAIFRSDPSKSQNLINNSINVLRHGMNSIRETLKDIKPKSEQLGLHNLKLIINEATKASGIDIVLTYEGQLSKITYVQWKVILNNCQEAITNSLKYSECSKITIDIKLLAKIIKCEVKDNGKGSNEVIKGLGILGMEERTQNINGTLIIDGCHNGFSVITLLPYI